MTENTNNTKVADVSAEDITKLQKELRAKQAAVKAAEKLAEWEAKTKARNPAYVMGSVRKATDKDAEVLGHAHGMVCLVECQECGKARLINKQDAFQVRYCVDCRKVARQQAAKARREEKKLANTSPEAIQAEIADLQTKLAQFENKPAKRSRRKAS